MSCLCPCFCPKKTHIQNRASVVAFHQNVEAPPISVVPSQSILNEQAAFSDDEGKSNCSEGKGSPNSNGATLPGTTDPSELEENSKALVTAIKQRQEDDALSLINKGIDVNYRGMWENTPLILACSYGLTKIATTLIARKADVTLENETGCTALLHAVVEGCESVIMALLSSKADPNAKEAKVYVQKMDVYLTSKPLDAAAAADYPSICNVLIEAKAKVNDFSVDHMPLWTACSFSRDKVVQELLKAKAKPTSKDQNTMETCLDAAITGGASCSAECAKLLLANGCDVNKDSNTCLVASAITRKNKMVLQLLLDHAADLSRPLDPDSDKQNLPIHKACRLSDPEFLSMLVKAGADTTVPDPAGRTPEKLIELVHKNPDKMLAALRGI